MARSTNLLITGLKCPLKSFYMEYVLIQFYLSVIIFAIYIYSIIVCKNFCKKLYEIKGYDLTMLDYVITICPVINTIVAIYVNLSNAWCFLTDENEYKAFLHRFFNIKK